MKKVWTFVLIFSLALLVLGGVCLGLSTVLGSDLVRISDVVFSRYDLTQTILNFQALALRLRSLF